MSTALDAGVSISKERGGQIVKRRYMRLNCMSFNSQSAPWCTLEADCFANSSAVVLMLDVRGSLISIA